jgi:hypothetical protein
MVGFSLSGIYSDRPASARLDVVVRSARAVLASSLTAGIVLSASFGGRAFGGVLFFCLDFFLLLTLTVGLRGGIRLFELQDRRMTPRDGNSAR